MSDTSNLMCPEKTGLLMEYQKTTEAYATAVANLARRIGTMTPDEYNQLNLAAENARVVSQAIRDRLNKHIAERGC